jgi:hypothetical protein
MSSPRRLRLAALGASAIGAPHDDWIRKYEDRPHRDSHCMGRSTGYPYRSRAGRISKPTISPVPWRAADQ